MAETPFRPLSVIAGADPATPVTSVKFDPHHELVWAANENVYSNLAVVLTWVVHVLNL